MSGVEKYMEKTGSNADQGYSDSSLRQTYGSGIGG